MHKILQTFNLQSVVIPVLILLIHSSEKCRGELQYESSHVEYIYMYS